MFHPMQTETTRDLPSVLGLVDESVRAFLNPLEPAIDRLLAFDQLRRSIEAARRARDGETTISRFLRQLGVTVNVDPAELTRIPREGPLLAVANHPFGMLEGVILADLLPRVRPDFRILANAAVSAIPELRPHCIFIDPFGRRELTAANARALRECLAWLRRGGMVVVFPAGEVAHMDWKSGVVSDPAWHPAAARLAQIAGTSALPIYFGGGNSALFQIAGAVHPRLRTASLPRELMNKRGRAVEVRIGRPTAAATLQSLGDGRAATEYLRCRTYALETAGERNGGAVLPFPPRFSFSRKPVTISAAAPAIALATDVERLPANARLCEAGDLTAYVGRSEELPNVLREIGRLRDVVLLHNLSPGHDHGAELVGQPGPHRPAGHLHRWCLRE